MSGQTCGWIGVGTLGRPLCERLMEEGFGIYACEPSPAALEAIVKQGAIAVASPAEALAKADLVFSTVPSDEVLDAIVNGLGGIAGAIRPGQVFIDLSTVSPEISARVATPIEQAGGSYLRCPVSGSTANARQGTLTALVSGPEEVLNQVRPVLEKFSSRQLYFGAAEEARVVKLMVNLLVGVMPALLGETIAFGTALGMDRKAIVDAINSSVMSSPLTQYKAEMLIAQDWTSMASVDLVAKDADLALAAGRSKNVQMPFTALARQYNAILQSRGHGGDDFFRVSTWPEWGPVEGASDAADSNPDNLRNAVIDAEQARWACMRKGDAEGLGRLLAPELQYVHSDDSVDTCASYLDKLRNGELVYEVLICKIVSVAIHATTAVVLGLMEAEVRIGERRVTLDNSYMTVWAHDGSEPLMLAHKSNPKR